jgi:hypothetical protein
VQESEDLDRGAPEDPEHDRKETGKLKMASLRWPFLLVRAVEPSEKSAVSSPG